MKKIKTFFNINSTYNKDGSKLIIQIDKYLEEIFDKYIEYGFSLREIAQILYSSVGYIESKKSNEFSEKFDKKERLEKAGKI